MNKEALLNVAKALRESPNPNRFDMCLYGHSCNTPCCALGHYAYRTDLQNYFKLSETGSVILAGDIQILWNGSLSYKSLPVLNHFDITTEETYLLFSPFGCGQAKTAIKAAEFIEEFVRSHD